MQGKKSKGSLFIISAPSGAGKTTLCKKLVSTLPDLKFSISYTTRRPRPDEVNNRDYSFVDREDFRSMVERGEFIEWASVHGEFYGTSRARVEELLHAGYDVILDIDIQGATQIRNKYDGGTYIFILPPSLNLLEKRLSRRMTDSRDEIRKRLDTALEEIRSYKNYDYVIINDVLEDAVRECEAIIIASRVSTKMINPRWIEERFLQKEDK